ncbi:porin [Bombella sp. TMW 2.2543]|uniref:Porin n=1 Tax=Bombella pluederhausensis TaxID=2967336 RepID=A0ABT3WJP9_9PROT|nr:outer membrane beta-barrel protein [Bombella pluederhausensis]MCX5618017.1 porin [Bombella pluederhausensis]
MRHWRYLVMMAGLCGGVGSGLEGAQAAPSEQGGPVQATLASSASSGTTAPSPAPVAAPSAVQPATPKEAGKSWFSDIDVGLQIEGGAMANTGHPDNGMNFGQLLQSHSDTAMLNQVALTITKPVDPIGDGYGLGANIQMLYGSDARAYIITGISDRWLDHHRYQLTPIQANIALHMPWLTKDGLDMQVGILSSPMGVEVLNPAGRAFYTMSYTAQYSNPFEHVGFYGQWHLNSHYAVLFGMDAGNQKSFGRGNNNGEPAGYVGFNASQLAGGALSVTYLLRVGPEDPRRLLGSRRAHEAQRFWNDLNATWQINPKWSLTAEATQVHDEGLDANTWSGVVWGAYAATSTLTFNARAEVYRDSTGQFIVQYPEDAGYGRALLGLPTRTYSAPATTYGDLSFNAVWRPNIGHHVKLLQIRPEIRFDRSLNNTRPFADFRHQNRILIGGDVTLGF